LNIYAGEVKGSGPGTPQPPPHSAGRDPPRATTGHQPALKPRERETGQAGEVFQGGIKIKRAPSEALPTAAGQGSCPTALRPPAAGSTFVGRRWELGVELGVEQLGAALC